VISSNDYLKIENSCFKSIEDTAAPKSDTLYLEKVILKAQEEEYMSL